jgi:hypothetical protein
MSMRSAPAVSMPVASPAPTATGTEAEKLTAHFVEVMDALVGLVREETELVRAGRLAQAAKLAQAKDDLTRLYIAAALRLRASHTPLSQIMPHTLEALRRHHDSFRAHLQTNLTVLATAHAVSEGIVRGVSGELARQSAPQTYGASGRANLPGRNAVAPLTVSRAL